jgi:hypothetical protein
MKQASHAKTEEGIRHQVGFTLPALKISDGTLEGMKWLAIVLMTIDHFNKYILHDSSALAFDLGRIAMPLFAFMMAYNLARPNALSRGSYGRAMKRLAVFGTVAIPVCIALGGLLMGWWPLNILFMLLTTVAIMYLLERDQKSTAGLVFIAAGFMVEYWWPAIGFSLACWYYCKRPSWSALVCAIACCALLAPINTNSYALIALLVIFACTKLNINIPRSKWYIFYGYYPFHLSIILLIRHFYG